MFTTDLLRKHGQERYVSRHVLTRINGGPRFRHKRPAAAHENLVSAHRGGTKYVGTVGCSRKLMKAHHIGLKEILTLRPSLTNTCRAMNSIVVFIYSVIVCSSAPRSAAVLFTVVCLRRGVTAVTERLKQIYNCLFACPSSRCNYLQPHFIDLDCLDDFCDSSDLTDLSDFRFVMLRRY